MKHHQDVAFSALMGQVEAIDHQRGATITVFDAEGRIASLYSDNSYAGKANPFEAGADGGYSFYAANGIYSIRIAKSGHSKAIEVKEITLFDPLDQELTSIRDFGARADGATDDAAALAAAEMASADYINLGCRTVLTSANVSSDTLAKNYYNGRLLGKNHLGNQTIARPTGPFRDIEIRRRRTKSPIVDWAGKKILWLGTSIPAQGVGSDSYPEIFAAALKCSVDNQAFASSHCRWDITEDAFHTNSVRALSMTEADREFAESVYGPTSAYNRDFDPLAKASLQTCDSKIRARFLATPYDVVILDHNHNDRYAPPGTLTPERFVLTGVRKGKRTRISLSDTGTLAVGDGVAITTTGIAKLGYCAARVQAITGNVITIAVDSSNYTGTFTTGTLYKLDRSTIYGSYEFVLYSIYQAALEASASLPLIIMAGAPSEWTDLDSTGNDGSIFSVSEFLQDVAEKWCLSFFDVAHYMDVKEHDHLVYFPDKVHPTTKAARQALANHWVAWASGGMPQPYSDDDFLRRGHGANLVEQREAMYSKFLSGFGSPSKIIGDSVLALHEPFDSDLSSYALTGATLPTIVRAPWSDGNALRCVSDSKGSTSFATRSLALDQAITIECDLWLPVVTGLTTRGPTLVNFLALRPSTGAYFSVSLRVRPDVTNLRVSIFTAPGAGLETFNSAVPLVAGIRYRLRLEFAKTLGFILYLNDVIMIGPHAADDARQTICDQVRIGIQSNNTGSSVTMYLGNVSVNRQALLDYRSRYSGSFTTSDGRTVTVVNGVITVVS